MMKQIKCDGCRCDVYFGSAIANGYMRTGRIGDRAGHNVNLAPIADHVAIVDYLVGGMAGASSTTSTVYMHELAPRY